VHCPGCGADCPLPEDDQVRRCFTCGTEWFRHALSGDEAADLRAIRQKVRGGAEFSVVLRPVVVDVPGGPRGKHSELLDSAFVYLKEQG